MVTVEEARELTQEASTMALAMDFALRGVARGLAADAPFVESPKQRLRRFTRRESD